MSFINKIFGKYSLIPSEDKKVFNYKKMELEVLELIKSDKNRNFQIAKNEIQKDIDKTMESIDSMDYNSKDFASNTVFLWEQKKKLEAGLKSMEEKFLVDVQEVDKDMVEVEKSIANGDLTGSQTIGVNTTNDALKIEEPKKKSISDFPYTPVFRMDMPQLESTESVKSELNKMGYSYQEMDMPIDLIDTLQVEVYNEKIEKVDLNKALDCTYFVSAEGVLIDGHHRMHVIKDKCDPSQKVKTMIINESFYTIIKKLKNGERKEN